MLRRIILLSPASRLQPSAPASPLFDSANAVHNGAKEKKIDEEDINLERK